PNDQWADTEAGRLHRELLQETEMLHSAIAEVRKWYEDSKVTAEGLWFFEGYKAGEDGGIRWPQWSAKVEELLDPARPAPFDRASPRYAAALTFDTVVKARA